MVPHERSLRDDEPQGELNSTSNQKKHSEDHVCKSGPNNTQYPMDDGHSGMNPNCFGPQLTTVETEVGYTVIATAKDTSCPGCNHSEAGPHIETQPFLKGAWPTVTNNNADSVNFMDNDPILPSNTTNERHVKDISNKTCVAPKLWTQDGKWRSGSTFHGHKWTFGDK